MTGSGATSPGSQRSPSRLEPSGGIPLTHDPEFRGPVRHRSCTDVICLFLLLAFFAGWAVIAIFAFKEGNPHVLIYPTDSEGNICGVGKLEKKPYLFFFDLSKCARPSVIFRGCDTPQVCVSSCPNETFYVNPLVRDPTIKDKLICKYDVDRNSKSVEELVKSDDCAALYLKSHPLVDRCIPYELAKTAEGSILDFRNNLIIQENGTELNSTVVNKARRFLAYFLNAQEIGKKIFQDLKVTWHIILICLVCVMLLSLVWILLMRWMAGIMVWLSILLIVALLIYACYYSVRMYLKLKNQPQSDVELHFESVLSSYLAMKNTWLAFSIISAATLAILVLILIFLRKRIRIAIALIKEGSKAVGSMTSSLLFPIIPYALQLILFAFWVTVALYIASAGKASFVYVSDSENDTSSGDLKNKTFCDPKDRNITEGLKCVFQSYGLRNNIISAQAYNLIGLFWTMFFIIGIGQLSLAGAFATYYWTLRKPTDVPYFAICTGFCNCLRYHLGSIAFGSLLIATVKMVRVFLEYIDKKCKKYDNPVTRAIMCCMKCCFWCLENFLKFINKNAYIMIAVYGSNFCVSAKRAFKLLFRNILRVVVLDKVTDFLLFIGKLVVVAASVVTSFYLFTGHIVNIPALHYNLVPVIIVGACSYVIASVFFNVYSMGVDTLFLCFLEDCERNDGSVERPYYMSKELMKILDKRNKFKDRPT